MAGGFSWAGAASRMPAATLATAGRGSAAAEDRGGSGRRPHGFAAFSLFAGRCERNEGPGPMGRRSRVRMQMFYCQDFAASSTSDDFSQRRVHAVRLEGPLRRRHHHVLRRPALRPDRAERRRQVHVHEAADRRAAAAEGHGRRGPTSSACCARTSSPSTSFRVIDTVIMGNARLWAALEERELLYAKADDDRRGRHAPRRARGHRRRGGRLHAPRATRRSCCRASTSPTTLHERTMARAAGRPEGARAAGAGAVRPSRRRCCSTSRPTTSTSTRSTGCASSSSATTAR